MMKPFKDLSVSTVFTYNSLSYVKIAETKISCCKSINASLVSDPKTRIQVLPITEVEVSE